MRIFTTLFCLIHVLVSLGQNEPLDSLSIALNSAKSDTSKVNVLIDMAYAANDATQSLKYAQQAYELGKNTSSIRHQSRSELVLGAYFAEHDLDSAIQLMDLGIQRYLNNKMPLYSANALLVTALTLDSYGRRDSAMVYYEKCFKIADSNELHSEAGDAAYYIASILSAKGVNVEALRWALVSSKKYNQGGLVPEEGEALNLVGTIYDQTGMYSEAIQYYLSAKDLATQSGDIENEILINNNLGVIYDNMGNSEKSMNYYSDGLEKARINNMVINESTILNNLSYIHAKKGDTAKAISLLKKSLKLNISDHNPCFESYPLEGLASIHLNQKKLDSALYYLNKGLEIAKGCQDAVVISTIKKDLGQLYTQTKEYAKANDNLTEALEIAEKSNLKLERKEALFSFYEALKAQGNTTLALKYLETYQVYTDSLNELQNTERAIEIASEYEFRKELAILEEERRHIEAGFSQELESKSNMNKLILLALVLFILLTVTMVFAYRSIRKRNVKLKWLDGEKNKLIGIVAHDLRNPLNMIMGLIPLFKITAEETNRDDLKQYVYLMEASSEKMKNMIERSLDISSIENMKVNLRMQPRDLAKVANSCVQNFKMIAASKKLNLELNIEAGQKFMAKFDSDYLEQVLDNLLSNAIKFSSPGTKIDLQIESTATHHIIQVKDQGPGIEKDDQKRLFNPYTTLSSKPTDNERSSGLGLSIVQKFVHAMGGEISCESEIGKGTTFKVAFAKI